MAGQLVIVQHYEPPAPEETAELVHRACALLFDPVLLKYLTRYRAEGKIQSGENGKEAIRESGTLRKG